MQNPRLKDMMGRLNHKEQFMVSALEQLLGDEAVEALMDEIMPQAPSSDIIIYGRSISAFSGLTREQIKKHFGLNDEAVNEIYSALGVTEQNQMGADGQVVEGFQDSMLKAQKAKDGESGMNEGVADGDVGEARPSADVAKTDADGTAHADVRTQEQIDADNKSNEGSGEGGSTNEPDADSSRNKRNRGK